MSTRTTYRCLGIALLAVGTSGCGHEAAPAPGPVGATPGAVMALAAQQASPLRPDGLNKAVLLATSRSRALTEPEARELLVAHRAQLGLERGLVDAAPRLAHEVTIGDRDDGASASQLMVFEATYQGRPVLGSQLRVHQRKGQVQVDNNLVLARWARPARWATLDRQALQQLAMQRAGVRQLRDDPAPVRFDEVWFDRGGTLVPVDRVVLLAADPPGDFEVLVAGEQAIGARRTSRSYTDFTRVHGNLARGAATVGTQLDDVFDRWTSCPTSKRMGHSLPAGASALAGVRVVDAIAPTLACVYQPAPQWRATAGQCYHTCDVKALSALPSFNGGGLGLPAAAALADNVTLSAYENLRSIKLWTPSKISSLTDLAINELPLHSHAKLAGAFYSAATKSVLLGMARDDDAARNLVFDLRQGDKITSVSTKDGIPYSMDGEVVAHEFGHKIVDELSPGWAGIDAATVHEAMADFVSALTSNDPCMAELISCVQDVLRLTSGQLHECGSTDAVCLRDCFSPTSKTMQSLARCVRNLNLDLASTGAPGEAYFKRLFHDALGRPAIHVNSQLLSAMLWLVRDVVTDKQVLLKAIQSLPVNAAGSTLPLNPSVVGFASYLHKVVESEFPADPSRAARVAEAAYKIGAFDSPTGASKVRIIEAALYNLVVAWVHYRAFVNSPEGQAWRNTDEGYYWNAFLSSAEGQQWLARPLATADLQHNSSQPWLEDAAVTVYPYGQMRQWRQTDQGRTFSEQQIRPVFEALSQRVFRALMHSDVNRDFIATTWRAYVSSRTKVGSVAPPLLDKTSWRAFFENAWKAMFNSDQAFGTYLDRPRLEAALDLAWQGFVADNQQRTEPNWRWALAQGSWRALGGAEVWALLYRGVWGTFVNNPGYGWNNLRASPGWQALIHDLFDGLNTDSSWALYADPAVWTQSFVHPWWTGWFIWTGGWWDTQAAQLYNPSHNIWGIWGSWWLAYRGDWEHESNVAGNTLTYVRWKNGGWWTGWFIWTGGWWQVVTSNPAGTTVVPTTVWQLWGPWWTGWFIWTGGWWDLGLVDDSGNAVALNMPGLAAFKEAIERPMFHAATWGQVLGPAETFDQPNPFSVTTATALPTVLFDGVIGPRTFYVAPGSTVSFKVSATPPGAVLSGHYLPPNAIFDPLTGKFSWTVPSGVEGRLSLIFSASNAGSRASTPTQGEAIIEVAVAPTKTVCEPIVIDARLDSKVVLTRELEAMSISLEEADAK